MARFYNEKKYQDSFFPLPDMDNTSEEEKNTKEYAIAMAEAVWNLQLNDYNAIKHSAYDHNNLLRLYAQGRQPGDIYKSYLSSLDDSGVNKEKEAEGWLNVDFDNPFSFLPKFCNIYDGYMSDLDFDIRAFNIDIDSGAEEEEAMLEYWATSAFLDEINEVRATARQKPLSLEYTPKNINELEIIRQEGGFKQPYSKALEMLLKETEIGSNWDDVIVPKITADLRDIGAAAAYRYYEEETCKERNKYIDINDLIAQYSRYSDFRDSDYMGFRERMTISELRRKGFTEGQLSTIDDKLYGIYDNPTESEWKNKIELNDNYNKNDFNVDVLYLWWTDVVDKSKIEYITKNGDKKFLPYRETIEERKQKAKDSYDKKYGGTFHPKKDEAYISKKERVKTTRYKVIRHCKWIIGTSLAFDYGVMENQLRYKYNKPQIPISAYKISGKSLIDLLRKPEDLYAIGAFYFENALSKAVLDGYAVDESVLLASSDGGSKYDPITAINMHKETGYFIYRGMPDGVNRGGSPVPITKLPGNLGENMAAGIALMDRALGFVEDITGFSPVALGATPPKDAQVRTQQMALQSTNSAMRPHERAKKSIKQQLANLNAEGWQLGIKNDKKCREAASSIIGEDGVRILIIAKKLHTQYGMKLIAKPRSTDIQDVINSINESYERKRNNVPGGITGAQKIQLFIELKNGGNIYHIISKMNNWERKDLEEMEMRKQQNIILQNQGLEKIEIRKGQDAQELEKLKMRNMMIEADIETESAKVKNNNETRNDIIKALIDKDADFLNQMKQLLLESNLQQDLLKQNPKLQKNA